MGLFLYAQLEGHYVQYLTEEQKRRVNVFPFSVMFCLKPKIMLPSSLPEAEEETGPTNPLAGMAGTIRKFPRAFWVQNVNIFFICSILYTSASFFPSYLKSPMSEGGRGMNNVE